MISIDLLLYPGLGLALSECKQWLSHCVIISPLGQRLSTIPQVHESLPSGLRAKAIFHFKGINAQAAQCWQVSI